MDKLLSGRQVLVVEDEMLVLMQAEDLLAELGCEAVTAAAGVAQALALIDAIVFDVAMLDMNLDGEDTLAVADSLQAHGVPFVFATGYGAQHVQEGHRHRPVLKKPYQDHQLVAALTLLLTD